MDKVEFLKAFGKQVEMKRKSLGLSYRQLSQRCDVDYSDISKIEKGLKRIQLTTVLELCKGLGAEPKDLFNFEFESE